MGQRALTTIAERTGSHGALLSKLRRPASTSSTLPAQLAVTLSWLRLPPLLAFSLAPGKVQMIKKPLLNSSQWGKSACLRCC